jgi:hypothetical protein
MRSPARTGSNTTTPMVLSRPRWASPFLHGSSRRRTTSGCWACTASCLVLLFLLLSAAGGSATELRLRTASTRALLHLSSVPSRKSRTWRPSWEHWARLPNGTRRRLQSVSNRSTHWRSRSARSSVKTGWSFVDSQMRMDKPTLAGAKHLCYCMLTYSDSLSQMHLSRRASTFLLSLIGSKVLTSSYRANSCSSANPVSPQCSPVYHSSEELAHPDTHRHAAARLSRSGPRASEHGQEGA